MPIRFSVYIASSLDGYIARPDGDIRWLTEIPAPPDEDFGYHDFFETVDTPCPGPGDVRDGHGVRGVALRGEAGGGAEPDPAPRIPPLGGGLPGAVHHGPVQNLAAILEASGAGHVYVDGGLTIQSFLAEGSSTPSS
jgi:hypothetical protein